MGEAARAIGVFDSGVGGLTVVREIMARLPEEKLVYLGDTARVPYGTKSPETVIRYARQCARVLMDARIKMLVVACNTASACAVEALQHELPVPVLGVIAPGARAAVQATRRHCIGVIGTRGTIDSAAYPREIHAMAPQAAVHACACPLFVPLAEEGWTEGEVPRAVARAYLAPLMEAGIDTLLLGCTHYPLLRETIAACAGAEVTIVDSASATAEAVAEALEAEGLLRSSATPPIHRFLVSDAPGMFQQVGQRFLGRELEHVIWVDV
jgi:glutamate racemase